jgi:L-iditol 2-dehydrogenase
MKALTITDAGKIELQELAPPAPGPREVLLRVDGVGLCGTDFHIYEGRANYHTDSSGRPIQLKEQPQVLGHEFCGTVVEVGSDVRDLSIGDCVIADQGLNCSSRSVAARCEYCATGNTHQCVSYAEHGITGLQGALADFIAVPAVNCVRIESDLPMDQAALAEPLGCIIHSSELMQRFPARYTFAGERRIKSALICGAGPAGLLFTQYLRNVIGYDGLLVVSEPNAKRRALAEQFGALALDPTAVDLVSAIRELTHGEGVNYLIEAAGVAQIFRQIPGLLRKQGTILLYGHGHQGVDLGALNNVQFLEPTLIAPAGASGAIDSDGRPVTYRRALELLSSGQIRVAEFITHRYRSLADATQAFTRDRFEPDYIKGVVAFNH